MLISIKINNFWNIRGLIIRSTVLTPLPTNTSLALIIEVIWCSNCRDIYVFMFTGLGMGDKCRLPPGQHFYPFSFQPPPNLPSSFEGGDGYVRYTIRGVIDRSSWIKKDKDTKKPFTVIALLDLNTYPNSAVCTNHYYVLYHYDTKLVISTILYSAQRHYRIKFC